ncbi:MAG: hypothetical protein CO001_01755 [Candidatus Portnoybacteria bacterium CG_4_8_14_3_um_filter_40_10]|uniref:Uncharacterized protein n=2 Tax=Candidatus Portnoyibacteriota TaxID=1817913 RepID=A0A2M7IIQ7_9BACT|nr:MAG: hypothetical protein COV84_01645 [Candidatus Portnoybacteria bacterium CG11_big_fil_rev_8_21_14_0_20_40_15]PIW76361.1 MAG: hypothetical protein CO001_01755 [Candidatus Portnoybacteria bacterium CG_4_8_14_3_um_filter_40_10]
MLRIFCLMTSGKPLTSEISDVLLKIACQMVKESKDTQKGLVFTDFRRATLGSISGIVFLAEISTKAGDTSVSYIVRTEDIRIFEEGRGVWIREMPQMAKNAARN